MGPAIPINLWRYLIASAAGGHHLAGEVLKGTFIIGSTFGAGGGKGDLTCENEYFASDSDYK